MLARSLRHLLDGGGDSGVTLSAFRSRTPDGEGGPPTLEQVFLRLGGCLDAGGTSEGGLLTRTRWYCLPVKAPARLWEEAEEGVVYTVSSRSLGAARGSEGSGEEREAVSRHPSPPAPGSGSLAVAGQSRALKAGTLPRLVRHLLEASRLGDATYVPAFLATYRTFAAPREVVQVLLDRLQDVVGTGSEVTPKTAELRRALSTLLCSWLDGYPEDFVGLETGLREQLLLWLRWALGAGSGAEKSLVALVEGGALGRTMGVPVESKGVGEDPKDQDPDPHYILGLQAEDVAAQLTAKDAELFLRLVPHECLGSLWSKRDRKGYERACPTVRATVAQFNLVAKAVVSSCLGDTGLRAAQRARLLEKWIRVAEECFCLRNFSSLYAVVSALQSTPLHRLKRTWEETSRDCLRSYVELSAVCSEEDNYSQSRRLLFQEAYLRGGPSTDPNQRRHQRRPLEQRPMGVVPYLGTFLKDLVMLDAATRNRLQNGYINFEKHRKEFEILTQLRLLQANCRNYTLIPDPSLQQWLERLPSLSETQSYQQSCAIEPLVEGGGGTPIARPPKPTLVITQCTDLLTSIGVSTPVLCDGPRSPNATPDLLLPSSASGQPRQQQPTKWPSVSALDTATEDATPASPEGLMPPPATKGGFIKGHRRSASCGSAYPTAPAPGSASASDCRIIRVSMALQNGTLYKSILVTSQDKTPAVIVKSLEKHTQDRSLASQYELVQFLPEGRELAFPPTANVFYAMNGSSQDFMLRPKREKPGALPPPPPSPRLPMPRGVEISATFPKIKATGRKIARVFF